MPFRGIFVEPTIKTKEAAWREQIVERVVEVAQQRSTREDHPQIVPPQYA